MAIMYIVNGEAMDFSKINFLNYIEAEDARLGHGNKAILLRTSGSLIANGVNAVLSVYPAARVTALRSQAATWLRELGTWGGSRPGAGRPRLADEPTTEATILLPASLDTKAQRIGDGNRSAGIRLALEAFNER